MSFSATLGGFTSIQLRFLFDAGRLLGCKKGIPSSFPADEKTSLWSTEGGFPCVKTMKIRDVRQTYPLGVRKFKEKHAVKQEAQVAVVLSVAFDPAAEVLHWNETSL